ncbi:M14 family metallopeptidase [Comamonas granuli]|uniref:M14 family metallopeptidase n=1 Tax=Comamonas granuli TaxID=290309 RepID=UPI0005A65DB8|nr:M14 family metallocarboxypeptidase [Comamonas granuli]
MPPEPAPRHAAIGTPGQPWGPAEIAQWRARQVRRRSYADEVLAPIERLRPRFAVQPYGEVIYGPERYPLLALRSRDWRPGRPGVLVTGGVHGYETSGVHGALRFLDLHAEACAAQVNLLVAPCVSPWAYERIHRWNHDAIDPNRAFREPSPAQESAALMRLVAPLRGQFAAHIDLHETTDTDESEFRPALAARDGKPFEPGSIPDGFYLVDDTENPQPAFQQAIIEAVEPITHIAPADAQGQLIGTPAVARGVVRYPLRALGLCASVTGARYTTTTEVYPDSPRATPAQCNAAQAAAVCAAIGFVLAQG